MTQTAEEHMVTADVLLEWNSGGHDFCAKRLMGHLLVERDGLPAYEIARGRLSPFGVPFAKPWRMEELEPLEPVISLVGQRNGGRIISAAKGLWQGLAFLTASESSEIDADLRNTLLSVDGLAAHFLPISSKAERASAIWHGDCSLMAVFGGDATEEERLVMLRKHCRGAEHFSATYEGLRQAAVDFDPINVGRLPDATKQEQKVAKKSAECSLSVSAEDYDARTDSWLRRRFATGQSVYSPRAEKWMGRILEWYKRERPEN